MAQFNSAEDIIHLSEKPEYIQLNDLIIDRS